MKNRYKNLLGVLTLTVILLQPLSDIGAVTKPGPGTGGSSWTPAPSNPSPSPPSSSSSSVVVEGEGEAAETEAVESTESGGVIIVGGCDCHCETYEQYSTYHPKITLAHNINALCAAIDKSEVYYIPTEDELPVDLNKMLTDLTDVNGNRHQFALTYTGYFDKEANTINEASLSDSTPTGDVSYAELHTAKSVYASKYNDPALETIGYDLLLKDEKLNIKTSDGEVEFTYKPVPAGSDPLTAQVAVMDLYKAMNVHEFQIKVGFGIDEEFDANVSPILQELDFLTDKEEVHGLDTSEAAAYVGASRTVPKLYWDRFIKDGINTGLRTCDYDNLSTIYHLNTPLTQSSYVTAAQFCNLAVAIMNLYGEASLTDAEVEKFNKVNSSLTLGMYNLSEVELRSIQYLVCKGIIDAKTVSNVQWNEPVSLLSENDYNYNAIISWLGRIADPSIRLPLAEINEIDPQLADAGYCPTNIEVSDIEDYTEITKNHAVNTYDYLIEYKPSGNDPTDVLYAQFITYNKYLGTDGSATILETGTSKEDPEGGSTDEGVEGEGATSIPEPEVPRAALPETEPSESESESEPEPETLIYDFEEADYAENFFLDTNDIYLKGLKRAKHIDDLGTPVSDKSNKVYEYYYMGTETHDGKHYYRFRVSKTVTKDLVLQLKVQKDIMSICKIKEKEKDDKITYKIVADPTQLSYTLGTIRKPDRGGVYNIDPETNEWTKNATPFADLDYDLTYRDASTQSVLYAPMDNTSTVYQFYLKEASFVKRLEMIYNNADKTNLDNFVDSNGNPVNLELAWFNSIFESSTVDSNDYLKSHTNGDSKLINYKGSKNNKYTTTWAWRLVKTGNSDKYYHVEIISDDPNIKQCYFMQKVKDKNVEQESARAYVRSKNDATSEYDLMLSVKQLQAENVVNAYKEVDKGVLVLQTGSANNNVILNNNNHTVIVGDTIFEVPKDPKDLLYVQVSDGDYYVNYKAVMGWNCDYTFVPVSEGRYMVTMKSGYDLEKIKITNSITSVNTFFPAARSNTLYVKYEKDNANHTPIASGIALTGSYCLAPYMLVMADDDSNQATDKLFVWHLNNVVKTDGKAIKKMSSSRDNIARSDFQDLTGIDVSSVGEEYYLAEYELSRNPQGTMGTQGKDTLPGFYYVSRKTKHKTKDTSIVSAGWVYEPIEYDDLIKAINDYASSGKKNCTTTTSTTAIQEKCKLPLPIIKAKGALGNGTYMDVNLNVCKEAGATDYISIGTLPTAYVSNAQTGNKLQTVSVTGTYGPSSINSSSEFTVVTAPAGIFAQIKNLGRMSLKDVTNGSVYFGTSKCVLKDGKLTLADKVSTIDMQQEAVCSYLGTGNSSVFVVTQNNGKLSDLLNALNVKLEYYMTDPDNLVDWGKYTFNRLIQNADAWSTVVLIFILNILPRVCMVLFFVLMLLSLIKDFKLWQRFCHNVFDVYSFLTMGHQTVDTIDMKHTCIISVVCLALFFMIMDGQLFNFIIFVAKFIIAAYQH